MSQIPNLRPPKGKGKAAIPFHIQKKIDLLSAVFLCLEQIKNGVIWDPRFRFQQSLIPSPTVWVFMNNIPSRELLSIDRWRLYTPAGDDRTCMAKLPNGNDHFPIRYGPVLEDDRDEWDATDVNAGGAALSDRAPVLDDIDGEDPFANLEGVDDSAEGPDEDPFGFSALGLCEDAV